MNVYQSKLCIFESWCRSKKKDPLSLSSQELCDFFSFLFVDKKYQPVTIKGYRSAISYVYKLMGLKDPGSDYYVSSLIMNFDKERPTTRRLFPKWSLDIVLQYLSSSTFVPASSATLPTLTYKCVFLVTLATALRISEVHALSTHQDCLRRNMDGSVTLLTFPGFVAKNKTPLAGAQRVTLHPLKDCPTLCPVQALEDYLCRTQKLRSDNTSLFLSLRNPRARSSPTLLSYWVRGTIQAAYRWFQAKPHGKGPQPHQPGAMASSTTTGPPEPSTSADSESIGRPVQGQLVVRGDGAGDPHLVHSPALSDPGLIHDGRRRLSALGSIGGERSSDSTTRANAVDCFSADLSRPAHELRALAASIALHRGTPYAEVIRAVGWSSASTFARFYLRHLGLTDPVIQDARSVPHPTI